MRRFTPTETGNTMKKKMKYQAGGQMIDLALAGLQSTASGIANLKQNVDSGDFKKKNLFGKYADIMGATPMGMVTNPILQPLAQAFASPDKTVISGSPGMYATGGDLNLSSDAMKVQGNPNVTDGNQYGAVALDHNEVVTQTQQGSNFVFSHDLKDPITGKPFAQLAEKQSRAKGRAEKMLEKYPFDEQAKSTISLSNATLNHVSNLQEAVASKLGLRNSDGSTKQKFASGGPIPYQGFNVLEFQKLYNQNISSPNAPLTEDNLWGPKTSEAYNNYQQTKILNRQDPWPTYELPTNKLPDKVYSQNPTLPQGIQTWGTSDPNANTDTLQPSDSLSSIVENEAQYKTPWTFGDTLKGVELIGKSIGAFDKPEVDKPLIDRTQITKEAYDPTNALYQTNRTYNLYKNSLNTPSINLNRALSNSALAGKYSQDNQTLSQYDAMNKGAQTQYQQRAGQQAQFNVQSQFRTNDINAANRAAQDAVQQNFYSSVGQFGEDLNRKKYAADIINLYRNQVPDVFDSYIKSLMKTNGQ